MKKIISALLAICMCLSLVLLFAACGEESGEPSKNRDKGKVLLNGVPLEQYVIIYPKDDDDMEEAAEYLAACAKKRFSVEMNFLSDRQPLAEYEILLGSINRDTSSVQSEALTKDEYYIAPLDKKVWISGAFLTTICTAIDSFLESFERVGKDRCLELTAPKKGSDLSHLRVMTYNLLGGTNHTNRDHERINMVLDLIGKYQPDIFGVQEATPNWMASLRERFGDRYDSVGVGRYANGSGEASAIFYLKDKFECLDSGTRWLSETPDVPGSKLDHPEYTSEYVRIYTYAKLKEKATEKVFLHVNTHLDTNDAACNEQARILMQELSAYNLEGIPCLITGDFNFGKDSSPYEIITMSGFADTLEVAERTRNSNMLWVDHIFASQSIDVSYHRICTETYARASGEVLQPSDHKPVFIDCVIS